MPLMVANCSSSKAVWNDVSQLTTQPHLTVGAAVTNLKTWWTDLNGNTATPPSVERTKVLIYTVWNIWNEHCRRVYDNKAIPAAHLATIIKQEMETLKMAFTLYE